MRVALALTELPDWTESPSRIVWGPPLGLAYLAAYALKYARVPKLDVQIFRTAEQVIEFKPDLVGVSSTTPGFRKVEHVARRIKEECAVPVLVGGPHITALPGRLPPHCDVGVLGEGEETFREILEARHAGSLGPSSLRRIRGLAYRENARVVTTPPRPFIEDLDRIPIPARHLFAAHSFKEDATRMLTSRGCPYRCTFCSVHLCRGRRPRFHSPEYVVREIEHIRENCDVPRIKIEDELFTLDRVRTRRIVELLRERGLDGEFLINGYSRADLVDAEWCELLKAMGFDVVQLGLESMSENLLEFLGKTGVTPEANARAVDLIDEHGMSTSGVFIIGVPGETREDILKIHGFMMENYHKFGVAAIVRLRVYPGTPLWEYAIARGFREEELLDGVIPDEWEDTYTSELPHVLSDYPYLNEENIPRVEFAYYCDLFAKIAIISQENWHRTLRRRAAEAENARLREENERLKRQIEGCSRSSSLARVGRRIRRSLEKVLSHCGRENGA